jgi:hypothetical protein
MKKYVLIFLLLISILLVSAAGITLFKEDFINLSNWNEVFFPKIPAHTKYTAVREEKETFLRTESRDSASVIIYKRPFNPYEYPSVKWRWKIDNILPGADLKSKTGDDSPIRVYVAFAYNPKKSGTLERALYNSVKLLYGEYPPHSSLNYVWASEPDESDIITSAYTSRSKMIILEKGDIKAGKWVPETVNIISDYRRAFGYDPPDKATIGIMNDSDNTNGHAVSYITDMAVYR